MVVDVAVKFCGGGNIIESKPLFSKDSKWVVYANGNTLKVCSVNSGECVHQLRGHQKKVTGVVANLSNQFQIFSSALDDLIIKWDLIDGVLLQKFELGYSLHALFTTAGQESVLFGIRKKSNDGHGELVRITLPTDRQTRCHTDLVISPVDCDANHTSFGCKGRLMAAVNSRELVVHQINKKVTNSFAAERDNPFTCVACHPLDTCVATGTSNGKIYIWWNVLNVERYTKTTLHWHALPVLDLAFSKEGTHLLSGGHECVLVKWQVGSSYRDMLPRLSSPISSISVSEDNTVYALCHSNNVIKLVSSQLRTVQSYQGLTRGLWQSGRLRKVHTGLVHEPRTGALVLNGVPGHLQFYDMRNDEQLYSLDVVGENYISPENLHRPIVYTEIERLAFDKAGDWMATVERRDDGGETTVETRLRLWQYSYNTQRFVLNTSVESPHNDKQIHVLLFRPHSQALISTGADGRYRYWTLEDTSDIYSKRHSWTCHSLAYYHDYEPVTADFSEDGSLLAVGFNATLTMWDPDTATLLYAVSLALPPLTLRNVIFGRYSASHLVLCASKDTISVWNTLTSQVLWTKQVPVKCIAADSSSEFVAVFTRGCDLLIINPSSSVPIHELSSVNDCSVVNAIFLSRCSSKSDFQTSWLQHSQLYFLNERQEMLSIDIQEEGDIAEDSNLKVQMTSILPVNPLSMLLSNQIQAKAVIPQNLELRDIEVQRKHDNLLEQIVETPCHVLPPLATVCLSLIQSLLPRTQSTRDASSEHLEENEISDEEDVEMKDENDDSDEDLNTSTKDRPSTNTSSQKLTVQTTVTQSNITKTVSRSNVNELSSDFFEWIHL